MRTRLLGGLLLLAACGGDDGGPSDSNDIEGGWQLHATVDSDNGATCGFEGTMDIDPEGDDSFGGTYSGTITCAGPGGEAEQSGDGEIASGDIEGEFNDDGDMNGTTEWNIEGVELTGVWSASKD